MKQSGKVALGGMLIALSVVILLPTVFEGLIYTMAAMSGLMTMFAVVELNKKWAMAIYAATSILGVLFVPNKETVVLYIAFFGYYPVLKALIESRFGRVLEYTAKFALFNVTVILAYVAMIKLLGMPFDKVMGIEGENGFIAEYIVPIMLLLGNLVFILFDILLTKCVTLYLRVWQKRFRRLFRF